MVAYKGEQVRTQHHVIVRAQPAQPPSAYLGVLDPPRAGAARQRDPRAVPCESHLFPAPVKHAPKRNNSESNRVTASAAHSPPRVELFLALAGLCGQCAVRLILATEKIQSSPGDERAAHTHTHPKNRRARDTCSSRLMPVSSRPSSSSTGSRCSTGRSSSSPSSPAIGEAQMVTQRISYRDRGRFASDRCREARSSRCKLCVCVDPLTKGAGRSGGRKVDEERDEKGVIEWGGR